LSSTPASSVDRLAKFQARQAQVNNHEPINPINATQPAESASQ
jgi:hypothetical protein